MKPILAKRTLSRLGLSKIIANKFDVQFFHEGLYYQIYIRNINENSTIEQLIKDSYQL